MKTTDVTDSDWDEVKAIASHLGRSEQLVAGDWFCFKVGVCGRKKPFDRVFNIVKTDQGFIVTSCMEDINFTPSVVAGNTYVCKLSSGDRELNPFYLVDVLEVTNEFIRVNYHCFSDEALTKSVSMIHNTTWMKDEVKIVSFRKHNP